MKRLLMDTCRPLIHNCTIEILFLFPAFIAGLFPRAIFTIECGFYMRTYMRVKLTMPSVQLVRLDY